MAGGAQVPTGLKLIFRCEGAGEVPRPFSHESMDATRFNDMMAASKEKTNAILNRYNREERGRSATRTAAEEVGEGYVHQRPLVMRTISFMKELTFIMAGRWLSCVVYAESLVLCTEPQWMFFRKRLREKQTI